MSWDQTVQRFNTFVTVGIRLVCQTSKGGSQNVFKAVAGEHKRTRVVFKKISIHIRLRISIIHPGKMATETVSRKILLKMIYSPSGATSLFIDLEIHSITYSSDEKGKNKLLYQLGSFDYTKYGFTFREHTVTLVDQAFTSIQLHGYV